VSKKEDLSLVVSTLMVYSQFRTSIAISPNLGNTKIIAQNSTEEAVVLIVEKMRRQLEGICGQLSLPFQYTNKRFGLHIEDIYHKARSFKTAQ
jgi:hypothetical protein